MSIESAHSGDVTPVLSDVLHAHQAYDPEGPNPFDDVEVLPGLGLAVAWVVLAYLLVTFLLTPGG